MSIDYPKLNTGHLVNIGSGKSVLMRDFIEAAWRSQGKAASNLTIPDPFQSHINPSKPHMDNGLIRRLLGNDYRITTINDALESIM